MLNEFIPTGISLRVIIMENDSSKRKVYEANLAKNNEKNKLYHVIEITDINELEILSGCIYTDIDESR